MEALFDQENREPAGLLESDDDILNLIDYRRLNALCRLIEQEQLGVREQGASDRQLLLLAAAQHTTRPIQYLRQLREQLVDFVKRGYS